MEKEVNRAVCYAITGRALGLRGCVLLPSECGMTGDAHHVGTEWSTTDAVVANPTDDWHTALGTTYLDCFRLALAHVMHLS